MGRFYKTAKGEFVENKMYQPPIELMTKVIANIDEQINSQKEAYASIYDKIKAEGLKPDSTRLNDKLTDYKSQIESLSETFASDPLKYRNEIYKLRNLTKTISEDFSTGEIAAIQNQKKLRDEFIKEGAEKVNKKLWTQDKLDEAVNLFDYEFLKKGGTSYKGTGNYNKYNTENLKSKVDEDKFFDDLMKGWQPTKSGESVERVNGQWINKTTGKVEYVDLNELKQYASQAYLNNEDMQNYYNQQVDFYNRSGGAIGMSKEQVIKNISDKINMYADKYAYYNLETSNDISENPAFARQESLRNSVWLKQLDWQHEAEKENSKVFDEFNGVKREAITDIENNLETVNSYYNSLRNMGITEAFGSDGKINPGGVRKRLYQDRDKAIKNKDKNLENIINKQLQKFNNINALAIRTKTEASWVNAVNPDGSNIREVVNMEKRITNALTDPGQLMGLPQQSIYVNKQKLKLSGSKGKTTGITMTEFKNDVLENPDYYKSKYGIDKTSIESFKNLEAKDFYNQKSIIPTDNTLSTMNMTWNIPGVNIESNINSQQFSTF